MTRETKPVSAVRAGVPLVNELKREVNDRDATIAALREQLAAAERERDEERAAALAREAARQADLGRAHGENDRLREAVRASGNKMVEALNARDAANDLASTLEDERDAALAHAAALQVEVESLRGDRDDWVATCQRVASERDAAAPRAVEHSLAACRDHLRGLALLTAGSADAAVARVARAALCGVGEGDRAKALRAIDARAVYTDPDGAAAAARAVATMPTCYVLAHAEPPEVNDRDATIAALTARAEAAERQYERLHANVVAAEKERTELERRARVLLDALAAYLEYPDDDAGNRLDAARAAMIVLLPAREVAKGSKP